MKTNVNKSAWTKIAALSLSLTLVVGGSLAQAGGHGGGGHGGGHGGGNGGGNRSMGSGPSSFRGSSLGHSSSKMSSSLGGSQFKKSSGFSQNGSSSSSTRGGLSHSSGLGLNKNNSLGKNSGIGRGNLTGKNTGIAGGLNRGKNAGLGSSKNSGISGKLGSHKNHGDHTSHKGNHDSHSKHHGDHNGHGKHIDPGFCHKNPHCKPCPSNHWCPNYCPGSSWCFPVGCWGRTYVNVVDVVGVDQVVELPVATVVTTDVKIDLQLKNIELLDAGNPEYGQGPTYRITILNASDVAIQQGFDVGLVVSNGQEPDQKSPFAAERVEGIAAGELLFVEVQLPEVVNRLAKTQAGQVVPFSTLFVAVDAREEISEVEEGNNSAKVDRTAVPMAAVEQLYGSY